MYKYVLILMSALFLLGASSPDEVYRGQFGLFRRSLNHTDWGYTVVPDPTGSAPTEMVERFEVRAGDCDSNFDHDDCKTDRDRSEVAERLKETTQGEEYWYGWYIYVPDDYINIWPTRVCLAQFHQADGKPPVFLFENEDGGYHLDRTRRKKTVHMYKIIPESEFRGRWQRMEVHARWSRDSDGFFKVWANGELKVDYAGATMTHDWVYFKYGIYRTGVSRYNAGNVPTHVVYYTGVRRGATRESIQPPFVAPPPRVEEPRKVIPQ